MEKVKSISELNKGLCSFIKQRYFSPFKIDGKKTSLNQYANACNLAPSTISKINSVKGYNIPVSTIYTITEFEETSLEVFFKDFFANFIPELASKK
ncbi:hypothetical protein [Sphingobacterium sp. MYb382]|uniref:hypothetical protein n=1 Tax=Sphingobacterium sp. MYb382 TaxID=2745278 RepID=UPI0030B48E91